MTRYTKNSLDREARLIARNYRKEMKGKEVAVRSKEAKVEFWEIILAPGSCPALMVHLTDGHIINCAI